jgi:hypothetical protein
MAGYQQMSNQLMMQQPQNSQVNRGMIRNMVNMNNQGQNILMTMGNSSQNMRGLVHHDNPARLSDQSMFNRISIVPA